MMFKDTNKNSIDINKVSKFTLQSGSDIIGATSVSKLALNVSSFNENHPNQVLSAGSSLRVDKIITDRSTYAFLEVKANDIAMIDNYWHKFKPGDQLLLKRLNIERCFTIKMVVVSSDTIIVHLMNDRSYQTDPFIELDHFICSSGYPMSQFDGIYSTYMFFDRKIERNLPKNSLSNFYSSFNEYEYSDALSIKVDWEIDYSIKATKLRWRTIPRNEKVTNNIIFDITSAGLYSQNPDVSILSQTGRGAKAELTLSGATSCSIIGINLNELGGGYLSSPDIVIGPTLHQIIPSYIYSTLLLETEGRIDYVQVIDGGTGYTGASFSISPISFPIDLPQGITATGYAEIVDGSIKNIVVTNPGYGFSYGVTSTANVILIPHGTGGTGAILRANVDIASEWIYEDAIYNDKTRIIHGLKKGLPYEIQILCSENENFIGECKYSNSLNFTYYG